MNRRHSILAIVLAGAALAALQGGCSSGSGGPGLIGAPQPGPEPFPPEPEPGPPVGPRPQFGPTVTQDRPPPPVSGGTLLVARDGTTAFAADPDRDQAYIVDVPTRAVSTVALQPGDEPARSVEDANRRVHVVLRSGGAVATIDLATKKVVDRQAVCAVPRGITYDDATDSIYVACMSGELVVLPAAGGAPTRTTVLQRDLRDVAIDGNTVFVSLFRSATVLSFSKSDMTPLVTIHPSISGEGADPAVAWRMTKIPGGGLAMVHQRGRGNASQPVSTQAGGYSQGGSGDGCERSIVEAAVSSFGEGRPTVSSPALSSAVLPVDIAVSPFGQGVAVVATGNAHTPGAAQVLLFDAFSAAAVNPNDGGGDPTPVGCSFPTGVPQPSGQATAVAFDGQGALLVQTREPAGLFLTSANVTIPLSSISREDTGHTIFHSNAGGGIACASCHPEGHDDSRVWTFDNFGPRRTPSLGGTIEGTAPYHWGGEEQDFPMLVHDVFTGRMSGAPLESDQLGALAHFVNKIPAPAAPPPTDADAVARGKSLFEGQAGCTGCHTGEKHTNNATVDVGTGGAFQVPPLVGVGYRAPFLHMGCAATLRDRFTCGGNAHGNTSNLSSGQLDDLVAYLNTL